MDFDIVPRYFLFERLRDLGLLDSIVTTYVTGFIEFEPWGSKFGEPKKEILNSFRFDKPDSWTSNSNLNEFEPDSRTSNSNLNEFDPEGKRKDELEAQFYNF